MTTIKNSIQVKSFLRKYYQHDFYVEKDKRVKGEKVYVFTKSVNLPSDFLKDLKAFNPSVKINHNKILLSVDDWKKFIESLPEKEPTGSKEIPVNEKLKNKIGAKRSLKDFSDKDDPVNNSPEAKPTEVKPKKKKPAQLKEDGQNVQLVISEISQLEELQLIHLLPKATYENPFLLNKAIEKYLDKQKDQKTFTSDEKVFISQYTGYGGLEKYGASGKELLYEYFTPLKIIQKMWELAYKNGYKGGSVLEPAMGIGDFLRYVPKDTSCIGYEINPYSYRIATILYPAFELHHAAFETRFIKNNESLKDKIEDLPKFDLVIGNPPYGDFTGKYAGMGEKSHTRAITYVEYFILRGLQCLNPNGLLIYIIGVEVANGGIPFLQQGMTKAKEKILELGELQRDTYRLCNGLFDRTDVLSEIIIFKRK